MKCEMQLECGYHSVLKTLYVIFFILICYSSIGTTFQQWNFKEDKSSFRNEVKRVIPIGGQNKECNCKPEEVLCREKCGKPLCQGRFTCNNLNCVPHYLTCDGVNDCGDNSDEFLCKGASEWRYNCSRNDQFNCSADKYCIPLSWKCDGANDCKDGSDEKDCFSETCTPRDYKCPSGKCIRWSNKCNGKDDCGDGSDEKDCSSPHAKFEPCPKEKFSCQTVGRCVLKKYVCDGQDDCGDWSDEHGCSNKTTCAPDTFRCNSGKCIENGWVCDGTSDCDDDEDEIKCVAGPTECPHGTMKCDGRCLSSTLWCNGKQDCDKGEDEANCDEASICGEDLFPCASGTCISKDKVCDGHQDCAEGNDETECDVTKCAHLKCSYACYRPTASVERCLCKKGFSLAKDNLTCVDIDECNLFHPCSQTCTNKQSSFKCSCVSGYYLRQDSMSCKAKSPPAKLILATRDDIREVNLNGQEYPPISSDLDNAIAVDFHYRRSLIYWTDVTIDSILMAFTNGSGKTAIVRWGLQRPCGLAVDWYNDHIYWVDSLTRRVEVADLDGSNRRPLIWTRLEKPRSIIVHPAKSIIIWTDWGINSRIERAFMDGSGRQVLIENNIYWPNGITMDYSTEILYWVDAKEHVIESAHVDGSHRRKITDHKLPHPFSITVFEDHLYWTDWKTRSIHVVDKRNGQEASVILEDIDFPMGIQTMHPERQPLRGLGLRQGCAWNNGECSHLCLPSEKGHSCFCPHGLDLLPDGQRCSTQPNLLLLFSQENNLRMISLQQEFKSSLVYPGFKHIGKPTDKDAPPQMDNVVPVDSIHTAMALDFDDREDMVYWTDIDAKSISRAHLNGSTQEILIDTNLEMPGGLAVDWINSKLYITDDGTDRIEVSNLDGSFRGILIWSGLNHPRDIVVDPRNGLLFWSQWGSNASIERSGMDGTDRKVIIKDKLEWPNGLAIDYEAGLLYWLDAKYDTIEAADIHGNKRRTILNDDIHHPFGLAIYDEFIFWSDWHSKSIYMANKYSGKERKKLAQELKSLMDVRVFHRRNDSTKFENPCEPRNGGCSHLCLLKPGGYSCACPTGLLLQNDKRKCRSSPSEWLLVAHRKAVRSVSLDTPYLADVVLQLPPLHSVVTLGLDSVSGDLILPDSAAARIFRCSVDGFRCTQVVTSTIATVEGLAIEQSSRKMYWTDYVRHSIEVSELDGSNRKILFTNLDKPRAIITHYQSGRLFWTDWADDHPRIENADLDGQFRSVFVIHDILWPNGLAIDYELNELYWTDAKMKHIQAKGLGPNGKRRTVIQGKDVQHPYGVAIHSDWVYWTDWESKALFRASKHSKSQPHKLRGGLAGLMDIKALPGPKLIENACGKNNGKCSHLCLRNPLGYSCACPTGLTLVNEINCTTLPTKYLILASKGLIRRISLDKLPLWDVGLDIPGTQSPIAVDFHMEKQLLFYTDTDSHAIRMISFLNNSYPESLGIHKFSSPDGIAVDWIANNIYWTDADNKLIEVAKLNGSNQRVIIKNDLIEPRDIAVFPQEGLLFWTDWGNESKIERSFLDGSDRISLFGSDVGWPNGLIIDYKEKAIYWSDAQRRTLETSDLDGSNRIILQDNLQHPFGITLVDGYVYWTDWETKSVLKTSVTPQDESKVIIEGVEGPMEIVAIYPESQEGTNPCANNNGGCTHLCLYKSSGNFICACPEEYVEECSEEPIAKGSNSHQGLNGEQTSTAMVAGYIIAVIALVTLLIVALIYLKRRRRKEVSESMKNSNGTLTYTNPTYATSNTDVNGERRPFAWRRLHHDNPQMRRFDEKGEVAALISEGSSVEHDSPPPTPPQRTVLSVANV